MIRAQRVSYFSHSYDLEQRGSSVGSVKMSNWAEKGEVYITGKEASFYRENIFNGDFVLEHEDKVVAKAQKPSALYNKMEISIGENVFLVQPQSWFSQSYLVMHNEEQLGVIKKESWFSNSAIIELPDDWPVALQVFVFLLVVVLWQRSESAAAGGGGG